MPDSIAKAKAREILSRWQVTAPETIDPELFANDLNLFVRESLMKGSEARVVSFNGKGIITIDSRIVELSRKKFAISHEIGHFMLHWNLSSGYTCSEDSFHEWSADTSKEYEANIFAAELLMPEKLFQSYCHEKSPNFIEIINIANVFATSITATAIRYVECSPHICALIASYDNRIKWFKINEQFPYRILSTGTTLHKFAVAFDYFNGIDISSEAELVAGIAWLEDINIARKVNLFEQAFVLPSYKMVLSLIWSSETSESKLFNNTSNSIFTIDDNFTPDGKRYRW